MICTLWSFKDNLFLIKVDKLVFETFEIKQIEFTLYFNQLLLGFTLLSLFCYLFATFQRNLPMFNGNLFRRWNKPLKRLIINKERISNLLEFLNSDFIVIF